MIDLGKWAFGHSKARLFSVGGTVGRRSEIGLRHGKTRRSRSQGKNRHGGRGSSGSVGARNGTGSDRPAGKGDPYRRRGGQYAELVVQRPLHHTGRTQSTTPDDRLEQCWDMLRHKVSDAEASLPGGTSVTVQDDFSLVYGMFYALTAEGFSERHRRLCRTDPAN